MTRARTNQRRRHCAHCALLATCIALGCGEQTPSVNQNGGAAGKPPTSDAGTLISAGNAGASSNSANGGSSGAPIIAGGPGDGAHAGRVDTAGNGGTAAAAGAGSASAGSSSNGGNASASAGFGGGGRASAGSAGSSDPLGVPHNPVLKGYNADPQIASFDGKFYIYPTSDGFSDWLGTKFHAFSSTDLLNWNDEGTILDLGPDVSWADDKAWAPGIARKDGTYYFYFSAGQAIGVAKGNSPRGPFSDALGHALVSMGQYGVQAIDPYPFTDDDGRSYLYFGSSSSARVVELNNDMVSFKGTPQTLTIAGFREGSVAFKRNGKYYFMYSVNDTRSEDYNVAYGIGTSPFGPFTKATINPILQKNTSKGILGTGHNSVLGLPNGDYYIAYHRFAIPGGDGTHREVCLDRLEFNADGTIKPVLPTL